MSLTINNNSMASNAASNLANAYGNLSTSIERMSSGLRINSAADDAAGLAIREMMRSEITTTQQGIRNASDAISLIQTADGSLAIIDEKLTRMKELAEQAATGTYTTLQREIINSEYQAMAAEIDRIANSTEFNGIKLLDGSISNQHGGNGLKIHFGTGNEAAEDYYYINTGDARATSSTGLRVGGDAKNDIWGQGAAGSDASGGAGCCTAGFSSLNGVAGFTSGQSFSFGYNWDWTENDDTDLLSGKYLAGRYTVGSSESLQDLVDKVNAGTQSRVGVKIDSAALANAVKNSGATLGVCVGNESYIFGNMESAQGYSGQTVKGTFTGASAYGVAGAYWTDSAQPFASAGINLEEINISATGTGPTVDDAKSAVNVEISDAVEEFLAQDAPNIDQKLTLTAGTTHGIDADAISAAIAAAGLATHTQGTGDAAFASGQTGTLSFNLWMDKNGNFTSSEEIATSLGFERLTADVEVTSAVVTAGSAGNNVTETYNTVLSFKVGDETFYTTDVEGEPANIIPDVLTAAITDLQADASRKYEVTGQGAVSAAADELGDEAVLTAASAATGVTSANATYDDPVESWVGGAVDASKEFTQVASNGSVDSKFTAAALASAINNNADSDFWAMLDQNDDSIAYIFHKNGGDNNHILACDVAATSKSSQNALDAVEFQNMETSEWNQSGTNLSLGGQNWGTMTPVQTAVTLGNEVWNLTIDGRDVGSERDIWITNAGDLNLPGIDESIINGLDRNSFQEIQNASDAPWLGAEVRTQSSAQEALGALDNAIANKDKLRADLGALQNRLENTVSNLEIQAENLQASESRISDVDVATEMTEFTKNNVLVQAATSMLAQANSMSQMALSLIG